MSTAYLLPVLQRTLIFRAKSRFSVGMQSDDFEWCSIEPLLPANREGVSLGRVRIPPFSAFLYRYRNLVERFFGKLKHFRAIATRIEKHDANYLALIKLASVRIWMRSYESVT